MGSPTCWHPSGCEDLASYEAARSGAALCREHATEALDDGEDVYGPNGHFCRIDRDRLEIVEVGR